MTRHGAQTGVSLKVVGLSRSRAELLFQALEQVRSGYYTFLYQPGGIERAEASDLDPFVVLAGAEDLQGDQTLLDAVKKLRQESFFWGPVHLLLRKPLQNYDLGSEWAVYLYRFPPEDVRGLANELGSRGPLAENRRIEIVVGTLLQIAHELSALLQALDPLAVPDTARLRGVLTKLQAELNIVPQAPAVSSLQYQLAQFGRLPEIASDKISLLRPVVDAAQTHARDNGLQHLSVSLHQVANELSLQASDTLRVTLSAKKVEWLRRVLVAVVTRGAAVLQRREQGEVTTICAEIEQLLRPAASGDLSKVPLASLASLVSDMHGLLSGLRPSSTERAKVATLEHVVVVEDHAGWRQRIVSLLKSMELDLEIQESDNIKDARQILEGEHPALVLTDLGLPDSQNCAPALDSGLYLIKEFSGSDPQGTRYQHKFLVLTAARGCPDAVRLALAMGISPEGYIQKGNTTRWESEIRNQVRLALQPPRLRPPVVEVFRAMCRTARVEGLEAKFDYPEWCLLAVLADSRRGAWCQPDALARVLAREPYSLDPESRGPETNDLDPDERIMRQLAKYASDLRSKLGQVYLIARPNTHTWNFLDFHEEKGYRLNADANVLDRVDKYFCPPRRPTVLVVEDNRGWGEAIVKGLTTKGFETRWACCTVEALKMIGENPPDLLSLDLELPATPEDLRVSHSYVSSAEEFLQQVQRDNPGMPVAIFTAIPWRDDILLNMARRGVRMDDYLCKDENQGVDRLAASLWRLWQEYLRQTRILDWDPNAPLHPIEIDPQTRLLRSVGGYLVEPRGKGRDILAIICATPNCFVSRTDLIDAIFSEPDKEPDDVDNALDSHVKRIRRSITEATGGTIPGEEVICGERGVLWLRGLIQ